GAAPTRAADLFSLGVVFYEAATGVHPFRAPTVMATNNRILNEAPRPADEVNPAVPKDLSRIIARMLDKDDRARYSNADDVTGDLTLDADRGSGGLHGFRGMKSAQSAATLLLRKFRFGTLTSTIAFVLLLSLSYLEFRSPRNDINDAIPAQKNVVILPFQT